MVYLSVCSNARNLAEKYTGKIRIDCARSSNSRGGIRGSDNLPSWASERRCKKVISVIVCTYNRDRVFEETVNSFLNCRTDGVDYELLLLDKTRRIGRER
jgi:hypothetical protein